MNKRNFLNSAVNKQVMASQKFPHTFRMMDNICIDKLCTTTAVHFLWAKWFIHVCHYKGYLQQLPSQGECKQTIDSYICTIKLIHILQNKLLATLHLCSHVFYEVGSEETCTIIWVIFVVKNFFVHLVFVQCKCVWIWYTISHMHVYNLPIGKCLCEEDMAT